MMLFVKENIFMKKYNGDKIYLKMKDYYRKEYILCSLIFLK